MKKSSLTGSAATFAAVLAAGTAAADISPQQAWDDLETYFESFGYAVSGTEAMSGDTLTVSDVTLSMALPEDGGDLDMSMPEISFTDRGDGSVSVSFPTSMPIKIAMAPEGEKVEITLDYTHENLDMVISGDSENLRYDYSADQFGMRLAGLTVEGETLGPNVARFDMTINGMAGQSVTTGTDLRQITQEMTADGMAYDFAFNDPDSDDNGLFTGSVDGIAFEGSLAMPVPMDANDMRAAMDAGFAVDGSFSSQGSKTDMSVTERSGTTTIQTSSGGGSLGVKMSAEGIAYSVASKMIELAMQGPEIPLPVNASADEVSMNIALPVTPSDAPQDVALGMTFAGLQISDLLWNIFDQGKILPRDPVPYRSTWWARRR